KRKRCEQSRAFRQEMRGRSDIEQTNRSAFRCCCIRGERRRNVGSITASAGGRKTPDCCQGNGRRTSRPGPPGIRRPRKRLHRLSNRVKIPRRNCSEYHGEVESSNLDEWSAQPRAEKKENLLMRNRIYLIALASVMLVGCGGTPSQKDAPP